VTGGGGHPVAAIQEGHRTLQVTRLQERPRRQAARAAIRESRKPEALGRSRPFEEIEDGA
jgi:hypothetical protein